MISTPKVKIWLVIILFSVLVPSSFAATVNQTLYINNGSFTTVNNTTFPYLAFNATPVFNARNEVINVTTSDTLIIKVINNDSVIHGFEVQNIAGTVATINPADSISDTLTFTSERIHIYFDNYLYPNYRYMGLAGMICVNNSTTDKKFYWNIKEHQTNYNNQIVTGTPVNWAMYEPDYFTINGLSHPDLETDITAKVLGNIGDTMHIFMSNSGQSVHSIHFHGFHCRILFSSAGPLQTDRIKDTFSVKSMEAVVLEMIPDKLGEYTVHDHNLVAVSGGGIHPNGMMIIMKIE